MKDLAFCVADSLRLVFRRGTHRRAKASLASCKLPWALVAVLAAGTALLALAQLLHSPPAPPSYRRLTFEMEQSAPRALRQTETPSFMQRCLERKAGADILHK